MKTAIILHGMPSKEGYYNESGDSQSNCHWLPWLQHELLLRNILAQTPEMPTPYEPVYEEWKKMFERFELNEDTTLVGHSCGGGFLVRWLSENNIKVGKVVLVAPWIDLEKELSTGMFDFTIDKDLGLKTKGITVFFSTDDDSEIIDSVNYIIENITPNIIKKSNMGHFTFGDMDTREFPELLDVILN